MQFLSKQRVSKQKMSTNTKFDSFIYLMVERKQYKTYIKKGIEDYDILKYKIANLSPLDIKKMYYRVLQKHSNDNLVNTDEKQNENQQNSWHLNELKVFVWIVVCYAGYTGQHVGSLNEDGWNFLVSVFFSKHYEILQFQLLSLLKGDSSKTSKKWSNQQEELLKDILKYNSFQGKWNQIAKQFYVRSGKRYFRKPNKCRQHWFNHLNPAISHEPWSMEQDLDLIEHVNSIGKKWAQISIILGGKRTQHMIKNRYKSLQRKYQKEFQKSDLKILTRQMFLKTPKQANNQFPKNELERGDSVYTCEDERVQFLTNERFPTNIEGSSLEQQKNETQEINQLRQPIFEEDLIEITDQKFFVKTKNSMGLLSELDEDRQQYIESFLF